MPRYNIGSHAWLATHTLATSALQGFEKEQKSFARISGYVEQNDIHTPQLTVRESLVYSAHLRLSSDTGEETTQRFVDEVRKAVTAFACHHGVTHNGRAPGPIQGHV